MDLVKKMLYFGIGVTSLTKEKADKLVKDLKKEYNINEKEGRKMVEDLLKESSKTHRKFQTLAKDHVDRLFKVAGIDPNEIRVKAKAKKPKKKASAKKKAPQKKTPAKKKPKKKR